MKTNTSSLDGSSESFLSKVKGQISGVPQGFDRLRLRGPLRSLYAPQVMEAYLSAQHVLLKDFAQYVEKTSAAIRAATYAFAESWQRPVQFVNSSNVSKEDLARAGARRDGIEQGLIGVLSAVEPCKSFRVVGNAQTKTDRAEAGAAPMPA